MQEKTEKPTQRKLKKAKQKGEVAQSSELVGALVLLGGVLILWGFSSLIQERLKLTFTLVYSSLKEPELDSAFQQAFTPLIFPLFFILTALFLIAFFAHFFQTGWIWSWQRGKKKGGSRVLFTLLKVLVIAVITFLTLKKETSDFHLFFIPSSLKASLILKNIFFLLLEISLALLFLGICDFFYQKWKHVQKMHMTPQELRDEKKETEGDVETKSKMKHR